MMGGTGYRWMMGGREAPAWMRGRALPGFMTGSARGAQHRITFSAMSVRLVAFASSSGGPDETFGFAGMADPAIVVKAGARVSIELINSDPDTAHGLVITASQARFSRMPMMTAVPRPRASAADRLAQEGMTGMFIVRGT
jgi:hypothetical protein